MSNPTITCTFCDRVRDGTLHMRADHPPTAAKAWLKRTCDGPAAKRDKPCTFTYRAGGL